MNFKPKKHHKGSGSRTRFNKKPNPTNFSNLRSQRYLNQSEEENINPNYAEQIFELSPDCKDSKITSSLLREITAKSTKATVHRPDCILLPLHQNHNVVSAAVTPVCKLNTSKTTRYEGKFLLQDKRSAQPPKNMYFVESPRPHPQRLEKLSPKMLPLVSNETDVECVTQISVEDNSINSPEDVLDKLSSSNGQQELNPQAKSQSEKCRKSETPSDKYKIDLEKTINIEGTLWKILEGLRTGTDSVENCKIWWEMTSNNYFFGIDVFLLF